MTHRVSSLLLLKVRDILGLLTPLGADYVTRPFFPPPQRKTGKSGLATRDYFTDVLQTFGNPQYIYTLEIARAQDDAT